MRPGSRPVAAGVGDPADGGVDVHAEQAGEDGGRQVSGEGGEGRVPGGADRDAVPAELLRHAVRRDRLARDHAREEPSRPWSAPGELRARPGLFGAAPEELGQARGKQNGMAAQDQAVVLAAELEVVRRQAAEPFGGRAEQQGDRAGSPDIGRHGVVGEAALEELPAIVLAEYVLRLLPRDGGDGQLAGEVTARGPAQEVADQVAALAGGSGDPVVDVLLREVGEGETVPVRPGQEFKGDAEPAPQVAVGGGGVAAGGRSLAGSSQQEPVQERAREVSVRGRLACELVLQPAGDALEVLVALVQDAGVDEELTDVALVPARGQLVQ